MSNGQFFKVHKTKDFTVMSNHHLKDKRLSLKAKGLMSLMLSLPENWDFSKNGLIAIVKEGRTVVENSLSELKEAGYLRIEENRDRGRFSYSYHIYEKPCSEKPYADFPYTDNQQQLNTNKLNTKESKTNNIKERKKEVKPSSYDLIIDQFIPLSKVEVRDAIYEFIKMRKLMKKPMTDKALELLLKKLDKLAGYDYSMMVEILNQSIMNNWQGVFPLKSDYKPKEATRKVNSDFLKELEADGF